MLRALCTHPLCGAILRFGISGSTAALVHLSLLYVLVEYAHLWYLAATTAGFLTAFLVGFLLQKFWTFRDRSRVSLHRQALAYLLIGIGNSVLNVLLLALFVEWLGLYYLLAQALAIALIACESFLVYRLLIFPESR